MRDGLEVKRLGFIINRGQTLNRAPVSLRVCHSTDNKHIVSHGGGVRVLLCFVDFLHRKETKPHQGFNFAFPGEIPAVHIDCGHPT